MYVDLVRLGRTRPVASRPALIEPAAQDRQGKLRLISSKELVLAFEAFEFVRPGWVRFDKLAELR